MIQILDYWEQLKSNTRKLILSLIFFKTNWTTVMVVLLQDILNLGDRNHLRNFTKSMVKKIMEFELDINK